MGIFLLSSNSMDMTKTTIGTSSRCIAYNSTSDKIYGNIISFKINYKFDVDHYDYEEGKEDSQTKIELINMEYFRFPIDVQGLY